MKINYTCKDHETFLGLVGLLRVVWGWKFQPCSPQHYIEDALDFKADGDDVVKRQESIRPGELEPVIYPDPDGDLVLDF